MRPLILLLPLVACTHERIGLDSVDSAGPVDSGESQPLDTGVDSIPTVSSDVCTLVSEGSPYGTEGGSLSIVYACEEQPDAVLTLDSPPAGATFVSNRLAWTPDLSQAGRYDLALRAERDGVGIPVQATVWVADAWADPDNVEVDPLAYAEEFGVPVLNVELPPGTNYSTDTAASLYWQGHQYTVGVQYRGASSASYPKHSFSIAFSADDEFDAPGWHHRRNINITSTFDDNAYLRQKTCYDLWSALSDTHPVFQTKMVVLYLNNRYEGLQLITDHIDGEWQQDNGGNEDGNLYKAIDHSANLDVRYSGARKGSLHQGYEKKAGDPDDWTDLDQLVTFVATSDDATFSAEMDATLSRDDFMYWWVFVRFVDGGDSAGKNSYLYHDPSDAASTWRYTPWDFNHSMGQDWQTIRVSAENPYDYTGNNKFFERVFADPTLAAEMTARMRAALDGPFAKDAILARIDDDYAEIDAAARRDWQKWQPQYDDYWGWRGDLQDYDGEAAYLRAWVSDRWDYLDQATGR